MCSVTSNTNFWFGLSKFIQASLTWYHLWFYYRGLFWVLHSNRRSVFPTTAYISSIFLIHERKQCLYYKLQTIHIFNSFFQNTLFWCALPCFAPLYSKSLQVCFSKPNHFLSSKKKSKFKWQFLIDRSSELRKCILAGLKKRH